jgi:ABC-type sugar transport system permease subunit
MRRAAGGWLLTAPLLLVLGLAYVLPFLGVVTWSVTLPTASTRRC